MRCIGILGGMSPSSTELYYGHLNRGVRSALGGLHSADCLIRSVDFGAVEALQVAGDWEGAGRMLAEAAAGLEAGGAELLILATNTMHKVPPLPGPSLARSLLPDWVGSPVRLQVAPAIREAISIPFLDIFAVPSVSSTSRWWWSSSFRGRCGGRSTRSAREPQRNPTSHEWIARL